jgi:hypothetical protein
VTGTAASFFSVFGETVPLAEEISLLQKSEMVSNLIGFPAPISSCAFFSFVVSCP